MPIGLFALAACWASLRDPDYLVAQRRVLSKGREWDWLGDPQWRVQTRAVLFVVGLAGLVFWELRHRSPVVIFRSLRERNFAGCGLVICGACIALHAAGTSLPGLLPSLFGYDALSAGLVMSPGGLFAPLAMPIVGRLLGRGMDARWLIAAGLLAMTAGNYWLSHPFRMSGSARRRPVRRSACINSRRRPARRERERGARHRWFA